MSFNGTNVGSPSYASTAQSFSNTNNAANFGNCVSLSGSGQRIDLPNGALAFAAGTNWCLRGRVRTTSASGTYIAVSWGRTNSTADGMWVGVINGVFKVAINATVIGTISVADGAWHDFEVNHIAGTGTILWIDGAPSAGTAVTYGGCTNDANARACIGALFPNSASAAYYWPGQIDEVAIFDANLHTDGAASFTPPSSPYAGNESNMRALYHLADATDSYAPATPPTTATLTGPTSGNTGVASSNFTVTLDHPATADVTITPAGTVGSVTFSPAAPVITVGNTSVTFAATPAIDGTHVISITNDRSLTNVNAINYATTTAAATAVTMSGPSSGTVNIASTNFTTGANGTITGTVRVTPSDGGGGGTFIPSYVDISSGTPTATFTYTAASTGGKTISVTNNGGLSNPSNITFTAAALTTYTRVDSVGPRTGRAVMALVPNAYSSNPYSADTPTGVVIYCSGAGEDQQALLTDSLKTACRNALIDAGYILVAIAAGSQNWGNDTAIEAYADLDRWVRTNYNVANVVLWGQSMGGLSALGAAAQNKVRGVVGLLLTYPVCSLADLYSRGTYTGNINTAYSITGIGLSTYANMTYGSDPLAMNPIAFRGVPVRVYASNGDTVVPKSTNADALETLIASSSRSFTMVACSGNHGDASHFVASEYVAFVAACLASPPPTSGLIGSGGSGASFSRIQGGH